MPGDETFVPKGIDKGYEPNVIVPLSPLPVLRLTSGSVWSVIDWTFLPGQPVMMIALWSVTP